MIGGVDGSNCDEKNEDRRDAGPLSHTIGMPDYTMHSSISWWYWLKSE